MTEVLSWTVAALPVPPPSLREGQGDVGPDETHGVVAVAVRLIQAHAAVLGHLTRRSAADFRPLPMIVAEVQESLNLSFGAPTRVPPSLVGALAPLVAPRLERLVDHLRQRLARERTLLPLRAVREMDPACLRRNARRPGRTLIEKAGPQQRLVAVRRVPRYDTMENRALVAAAHRLQTLAERQLAGIRGRGDAPSERSPGERSLRRLALSCVEILSRPELDGVGSPRPGERPSNALLGDPDYRAAWRAWQLLRREEERFAEEWTALDIVWSELVLLAAWAAIGQLPGAESLPDWLVVSDARTTRTRVGTGAPRRWILLGESPSLLTVSGAGAPSEEIRLRRTWADGRTTAVDIPTHLGVVDRHAERVVDLITSQPPTRALARRRVAEALAELGLAAPESATIDPTNPMEPSALVGLSALDAHTLACDQAGVRSLGPSAAIEVPVRDEAPLFLAGRGATWLPGFFGPAALHSPASGAPELCGALLAAHTGLRDTAVVVPDTLNEAGVSLLRRRLGRAWMVWSPVAAALAVPLAALGSLPEKDSPQAIAFVVLTDATLDVAVLERTVAGEEPLWIRSAPLQGDARGREARRFESALPLPVDGTSGAWSREPTAGEGWTVVDDAPRQVKLSAPEFDLADVVGDRLKRWRGAAPTCFVVVGLDSCQMGRLESVCGGLPIVALGPDALVRGAHAFLERHLAGLPTWKDRLPRLDIRVCVDRDRQFVSLVRSGTLVAPGQELTASPPDVFSLEAGQDRILLDLRGEGDGATAALVVEGPPLPLNSRARVRIEVRYTYGLSGFAGHLLPVNSTSFTRIPFVVSAAIAEETAAAPSGPPPLPMHPPSTAEDLARLRKAHSAFQKWWDAVPLPEKKQAAKQAGRLDKPLRENLRPLRDALSELRVVDSPALRHFLEMEAAPTLDWLLGFGIRKGAGTAPDLSRDLRLVVLRCRADARIRGDGAFTRWVRDRTDLLQVDVIRTLGRIIDGHTDALWRDLLTWRADDPGTQEEWARAVVTALRASPAVATSLDEDQTRGIFARALGYLEAIVSTGVAERQSWAIYRLASLFPWLCVVRERGLIPPSDPVVQDARERLERLHKSLPPSVRKAGTWDAVAQNEGSVALAADWLAGRYESIPSIEDR